MLSLSTARDGEIFDINDSFPSSMPFRTEGRHRCRTAPRCGTWTAGRSLPHSSADAHLVWSEDLPPRQCFLTTCMVPRRTTFGKASTKACRHITKVIPRFYYLRNRPNTRPRMPQAAKRATPVIGATPHHGEGSAVRSYDRLVGPDESRVDESLSDCP
jgi:hypothetical protein